MVLNNIKTTSIKEQFLEKLMKARIMRANSLRHGKLFFPDRSLLLPADCHFNPTIAVFNGKVWMIYRRLNILKNRQLGEWPRKLALCELSYELQPKTSTNFDLSKSIRDPSNARKWHADARLFIRRDELWFSYHDNVNLFIAPLMDKKINDSVSPIALELTGMERRARERNWGFFFDKSLRAVYSIDPHIVLKLKRKENLFEATPQNFSESNIPWDKSRWGEPHGGTPPIKVGSFWFSFFQSNSCATKGTDKRIYRVGFYGFDQSPPYKIRFMSKTPIIEGSDFPEPYSFWREFEVAYPAGAIYVNGYWVVSIGIHDNRMALAIFSHKELLANCKALKDLETN